MCAVTLGHQRICAGTDEEHVAIFDKFQAHPSVFFSVCAEPKPAPSSVCIHRFSFSSSHPSAFPHCFTLYLTLSHRYALTYTLSTTGAIRKPTGDQFSHIPPSFLLTLCLLSHSADCSPGTLGLSSVSGTSIWGERRAEVQLEKGNAHITEGRLCVFYACMSWCACVRVSVRERGRQKDRKKSHSYCSSALIGLVYNKSRKGDSMEQVG